MRSNNNNPLTRDEILSRYFSPVSSRRRHIAGLSGGAVLLPTILTVSCCAVITTLTLHQPIFTSLPRLIPIAGQSCAASAFYTPGWMAVEYLHGVVNSALPDADELAALLYHLHQQPRFGWRIALSPLLAQYWSCCDPARRTPFWLRRLKQLQKTVNLARFGSRLCIWMSMATI